MKGLVYTMRFISAIAFCLCISCPTGADGQEPTGTNDSPFAANDVSWLLPPPRQNEPNDVTSLIALTDLQNEAGEPLLSEASFRQFIDLVEGPAGLVEGSHRIKIPDSLKTNLTAWKVAAFRMDPSAPGCSEAAVKTFGSAPQLRLIVQPVEVVGSNVKVHDIAMHILFTFLSGREAQGPGMMPLLKADHEKTKSILSGLRELKSFCQVRGVDTTGKPLGVHPGLMKDQIRDELLSKLRTFFKNHSGKAPPSALAIMGLPSGPEPWIFLATLLPSPTSGYAPIDSPGTSDNSVKAQMLSFITGPRKVIPAPASNNLNSMTAIAHVPLQERRGVSTGVLFEVGLNLSASAQVGKDAQGNVVLHPTVKNRDIPDIVANPVMSHFFNTDCISCHTETTRSRNMGIPHGAMAFRIDGKVPTIESSAVPTSRWNVRNFGWFQSTAGQPVQPTVTQRTANETAEVVEFINREFLGLEK